MLGGEGYPAGVPCWIDTAQPDPRAAADFYGALFGWALEDQMPPGSPGPYFLARLDGREVAAVSGQAVAGPARWSTYIAVDRADDSARRIRAAGGTLLTEPFDVFDAGRMAVAADPAGAVFSIWQAGRHQGAQLVNAANSWNWSDLQTPDPAGAEAFYGEVFGWEHGGGLWRRPGYGDVLERHDPDLRRRHAEFGAPAGFADAVARLVPLAHGELARWGVTFAVADADASADAAIALGGRVVTAPRDVSDAVRVAGLTDPQGAAFEVSAFAAR